MSHVMVDIESLGTLPGSVVLSIGAVSFDDHGNKEEFYRAINVFDSLLHGLTINADTVAWWQKQTREAKAAIMARDAQRGLVGALGEFEAWLHQEEATDIWAHPPEFDLVLLEAAYRAAKLERPWNFRHARHLGTLLELAGDVEILLPDGFIEHHALHDAREQADKVRAAYRKLGKSLQ